MDIEVTFPGGLAIDAHYKGHTIRTDQPVHAGGGGTGPSPFDLFLTSIATCAGFYALRFCQERGLDTAGLRVGLGIERNPEDKRVSVVRLEVKLPEGFPEKYRGAILRAMDQCPVKRHIIEAPRFELEAV